MLHHLTLWVPELERAEKSWGWLLGRLGYSVDRSVERLVLFRHPDGLAIAFEHSEDMVEGMLYSRMRPGMNHLAFAVGAGAALDGIIEEAAHHGWSLMSSDRHPIAGGARVAYLEDQDGFEVELVVTR